MMSLEVVGSHSLQILIQFILAFCSRKITNGVCNGCLAEVLDFPVSICKALEDILLGFHKTLSEENLPSREFPLLCKFVFEDQVYSVFSSIVKTSNVSDEGIDFGKILGCSTVLLYFPSLLISQSMGRMVVNIPHACVGIVVEYVFIEFADLLILFDVLPLVAPVLIHCART